MSQVNVERVIGRLVTDEPFRNRFSENPGVIIEEMVASGVELTSVERVALARVDCEHLRRLADAMDPRIMKVDGCRGRW